MLIDKVWITVDRKFNLGDWESVQYSASFSGAVDNGEDPTQALKLLLDLAEQEIADRVPYSYKRKNPNWREKFTKFGKEVDKGEMTAFVDDRFVEDI